MEPLKPDKDSSEFAPSQQDIEAFARGIFPVIRAYYATEEGQKAFEEWKQQRGEEKPL